MWSRSADEGAAEQGDEPDERAASTVRARRLSRCSADRSGAMRRAERHASFVIAILCSLAPSPSIARADRQSQLTVETKGISVLIDATPGCVLSGEDAEGRARATNFLDDLRRKIGDGFAKVEFPVGFTNWRAEVELESDTVPSGSYVRRIRVLHSVPRLDERLQRATYASDFPKLPNFRARCTFTIGVRALDRPGE